MNKLYLLIFALLFPFFINAESDIIKDLNFKILNESQLKSNSKLELNLEQLYLDYDNNNLPKEIKRIVYAQRINLKYSDLPIQVRAFMVYLIEQQDMISTTPAYKLSKIDFTTNAANLLYTLVPVIELSKSGAVLTYNEQLQLVQEKIQEQIAQGLDINPFISIFK